MNLEAYRQLGKAISQAKSFTVFTGAGISTESGIPDFRSPGGVWSKYRTVYFDEFVNSEEARHEYWRQKSEAHREFSDSKPNDGHLMLAKWEAEDRLRGVITQNIDELHQQAGSKNVLELHGTARKVACIECGDRHEADPMVSEFLSTDKPPVCKKCGGPMKHATVSFGQSLPVEVLNKAGRWSRESDLFFAIGSSLVVTPAADLPRLAKQSGATLVIINRAPTPLDDLADFVISDSIGHALTSIDKVIEEA